ncbi:serine threonine protein kinase [Penicillium digitatum]|uniref:Uncharacterized protein n=3 Tax=Penicillium digitatum TaxID=36651 RepID=K9FUQ5_PEND2|nr:hypothetical protein PDIP_86160 [Penicillium digitatum Pd1]EKV04775.1 hypothetical protein PDIP_86160 [Penicillium digitatum Pd1]EKV12854.1 hypothetical protein PDIG_41240 [Penicillium digitatum PHI26]KAG0159977.1 hypothetical protein PDIDSM_7504 [Penicillium digitatum]QQK45916.1 serine threonine protein kinase [Penicillium digitatum]
MSNKRQVFLSLHHRDALSIGGNRQRFGHAAYHWGIVISPKISKGPDCYAFDVSDGIILDPARRVNLNQEGNWFFRGRANINPEKSGHLLGRVMIGKVPNEVTYVELHGLLEAIPLPQKSTLPEQNCVTWTRAAICKLQENGLVEQFDLGRFMDESLAFADQRLQSIESKPASINYTGRRM